MKRRKFITSLAVLGCTALVPLPKIPAARVYQPLIENDFHMDLTPEMLKEVFEYFSREALGHIRFWHPRDKKIMDMLRK